MGTRTPVRLSILFVTALLAWSPASAQKIDFQSEEWMFLVEPNLWATGATGTVSVAPSRLPFDLDFDELFGKVDIAGNIRVEAAKRHWGGFLDATYISADDDEAGALNAGRVKFRQAVVDLAGFYRWTGEEHAVDLFFGPRWWSTDQELFPVRARPVGRNETWVDGMLGVRVVGQPGEHWIITFRGDISAGGSDFAWNTSLMFHYAFQELVSIGFGYRRLNVDFVTGEGLDGFALDARFDGPLVGLSFRF